MVKVLFVCSGNICRSPTAEGVFRKLVEDAGLGGRIEVDSAATGDWHVGEAPDRRSAEAAHKHGIDIGGQRARQATPSDFDDFDYILAMDGGNHRKLARLRPLGREGASRARLAMLLHFAPGAGTGDVPDPYYGGPGGFDAVLDLIRAGAAGLLAHIRANDLS